MIDILKSFPASFSAVLLLFMSFGCGSKPLPDSLPGTAPAGSTPNSLLSSGDAKTGGANKGGWKLLTTKEEVKLDPAAEKKE